MITLKIKRLSPRVSLPKYAKPGDAAFDLQANIDAPITLQPGEMAAISSGIAMEIPAGYYGHMVPRSSMGKRGITQSNGAAVIDSGYRGDWIMQMRNISNEPQTIQPLERLCQVVILPLPEVQIVEVEELSETERGEGGLGSSGTH